MFQKALDEEKTVNRGTVLQGFVRDGAGRGALRGPMRAAAIRGRGLLPENHQFLCRGTAGHIPVFFQQFYTPTASEFTPFRVFPMPQFYHKTVYHVIAQLVYHVTTLYILAAGFAFVIDSTPFYRKRPKVRTFRAANSRPYGRNVRCLKRVNNNLAVPQLTIWKLYHGSREM